MKVIICVDKPVDRFNDIDAEHRAVPYLEIYDNDNTNNTNILIPTTNAFARFA